MEPETSEEPVCARCHQPPPRGDELRPCLGCDQPLCARGPCSRDGYENLARRTVGRTCATCARKREIVPRAGGGKGAGSAAGVEAVDRARYYILEATEELERRLRQLSIELAERISGVVEGRLDRVGEKTETSARAIVGELETATARQIDRAAEKLGRALEDALARGLGRGAGEAQGLVGKLGTKLVLVAIVAVIANAALTVAITLALR